MLLMRKIARRRRRSPMTDFEVDRPQVGIDFIGRVLSGPQTEIYAR